MTSKNVKLHFDPSTYRVDAHLDGEICRGRDLKLELNEQATHWLEGLRLKGEILHCRTYPERLAAAWGKIMLYKGKDVKRITIGQGAPKLKSLKLHFDHHWNRLHYVREAGFNREEVPISEWLNLHTELFLRQWKARVKATAEQIERARLVLKEEKVTTGSVEVCPFQRVSLIAPGIELWKSRLEDALCVKFLVGRSQELHVSDKEILQLIVRELRQAAPTVFQAKSLRHSILFDLEVLKEGQRELKSGLASLELEDVAVVPVVVALGDAPPALKVTSKVSAKAALPLLPVSGSCVTVSNFAQHFDPLTIHPLAVIRRHFEHCIRLLKSQQDEAQRFFVSAFFSFDSKQFDRLRTTAEQFGEMLVKQLGGGGAEPSSDFLLGIQIVPFTLPDKVKDRAPRMTEKPQWLSTVLREIVGLPTGHHQIDTLRKSLCVEIPHEQVALYWERLLHLKLIVWNEFKKSFEPTTGNLLTETDVHGGKVVAFYEEQFQQIFELLAFVPQPKVHWQALHLSGNQQGSAAKDGEIVRESMERLKGTIEDFSKKFLGFEQTCSERDAVYVLAVQVISLSAN